MPAEALRKIAERFQGSLAAYRGPYSRISAFPSRAGAEKWAKAFSALLTAAPRARTPPSPSPRDHPTSTTAATMAVPPGATGVKCWGTRAGVLNFRQVIGITEPVCA